MEEEGVTVTLCSLGPYTCQMDMKKRFLPSFHSSHWNRAAGGLSMCLSAWGAGAEAETQENS